MNKFVIYLILISVLISCNKNKEVVKKYENGVIESIHHYDNKKIDSSFYYYPTKEIKQKIYYNDSLSFTQLYDENGNKTAEGNLVQNDRYFRIGKWRFFLNQEQDSIVEYINVNNKPYLNQYWIVDKKSKDTIANRGNFYYIYTKDSMSIKDTLKIRFYLYQPHFSYNSEMDVIMPKYVEDLKEDFSNFNKIEIDTFYSLKNDRIPHPEIPKEVPLNHNANFGIIFRSSGNNRLRGYIAEYYEEIEKDSSITRIERRLYFDERIHIHN